MKSLVLYFTWWRRKEEVKYIFERPLFTCLLLFYSSETPCAHHQLETEQKRRRADTDESVRKRAPRETQVIYNSCFFALFYLNESTLLSHKLWLISFRLGNCVAYVCATTTIRQRENFEQYLLQQLWLNICIPTNIQLKGLYQPSLKDKCYGKFFVETHAR